MTEPVNMSLDDLIEWYKNNEELQKQCAIPVAHGAHTWHEWGEDGNVEKINWCKGSE